MPNYSNVTNVTSQVNPHTRLLLHNYELTKSPSVRLASVHGSVQGFAILLYGIHIAEISAGKPITCDHRNSDPSWACISRKTDAITNKVTFRLNLARENSCPRRSDRFL